MLEQNRHFEMRTLVCLGMIPKCLSNDAACAFATGRKSPRTGIPSQVHVCIENVNSVLEDSGNLIGLAARGTLYNHA